LFLVEMDDLGFSHLYVEYGEERISEGGRGKKLAGLFVETFCWGGISYSVKGVPRQKEKNRGMGVN